MCRGSLPELTEEETMWAIQPSDSSSFWCCWKLIWKKLKRLKKKKKAGFEERLHLTKSLVLKSQRAFSCDLGQSPRLCSASVFESARQWQQHEMFSPILFLGGKWQKRAGVVSVPHPCSTGSSPAWHRHSNSCSLKVKISKHDLKVLLRNWQAVIMAKECNNNAVSSQMRVLSAYGILTYESSYT